MFWWRVCFDTGEGVIERFLKAETIYEAAKKIPRQSWFKDQREFTFALSAEIVTNHLEPGERNDDQVVNQCNEGYGNCGDCDDCFNTLIPAAFDFDPETGIPNYE